MELTLSVPTEEIAASICDNWQKKSGNLPVSGSFPVLTLFKKLYTHLCGEQLFLPVL